MRIQLTIACLLVGSSFELASAQWTTTSSSTAKTGSRATVQSGSGSSFLGGSDECTTATVIMGAVAAIPFDLTNATTGVDGQTETLCEFFGVGNQGILNDEWWLWTADADGIATISTCGSALDTKISVYPNVCPPAPQSSLACKDDTICALETAVGWEVTNGTSYLIQIGLFPGAPAAAPGPGSFDITIVPAVSYQRDTDTTNNAIGVVGGGDTLWLQAYEAEGGADTIVEVHTAFGTPGSNSPLDGSPVTIAVWNDPNNDGDPNDAVLLHSQTGVSASTSTSTPSVYVLTTPVPVSGTFFIGAVMRHLDGETIAPLDQITNSNGRAWLAAEATPPMDLMNLATTSVPIDELRNILEAFDGSWMLRAVGTGSGTQFAEACNGDGGDQMGCTFCPCGNNSPMGTVGGCINSAGTSMRILLSGTSSIASADLRVEASGAPPQNSCQLTSGNALAPANAGNPCFGLDSGIQSVSLDGLRCVVQGVLRHGVRPSDANGDVGVTTNGWGTPNGFFNFGAFMSGQTKHFQIINRDDAAQVCLTGQNTSQSATVTFGT